MHLWCFADIRINYESELCKKEANILAAVNARAVTCGMKVSAMPMGGTYADAQQ